MTRIDTHPFEMCYFATSATQTDHKIPRSISSNCITAYHIAMNIFATFADGSLKQREPRTDLDDGDNNDDTGDHIIPNAVHVCGNIIV